jgi:hypothetical protein
MFTWEDQTCDAEIMKRGRMVAMTDANKETNIRLVETISNEIGKKLDWHYAAGRGIIKALPEDALEAFNTLNKRYPNGKLDETYSFEGLIEGHYSIVLYAPEGGAL